jgi:hypothetical protein
MRPVAQPPPPRGPDAPTAPPLVSRPLLLFPLNPRRLPFNCWSARPTSPHRGPAPATHRLPGSLFVSACCEESRLPPVSCRTPQHELPRFLPPESYSGPVHWNVDLSLKRSESSDWIITKERGGYWWRAEKRACFMTQAHWSIYT